ncbi:MAG: hypothetical protein WKG00_05515 [Polyangiaceae bacterium]
MNTLREIRQDGELEDDRGAIMIMGLVMAMWLCGCLWMIVGIGDAAMQRERLQDGADAAAYASAVYHARGMNVIVMINLVMAAILSVLAALKTSELLNNMYLWIVTANCACYPVGCPFDCPYIVPSTALADDLSARIQAMEQLTNATLTALSAKQKMIAMQVPHQGKQRGDEVLKEYKSQWGVDNGKAVSLSMIPGGQRIGMPVQEDKHKTLCDNNKANGPPEPKPNGAKEVIGEVAMNPLTAYVLMPAPSGAYFIVAGYVPAAVNTVTSSLCDNSESNGKTPKRIFDSAKNGDKYFQVYAFTYNKQQFIERSEKGTELLPKDGEADTAKNKAKQNQTPFELQKIGMAEAEFYYDSKEAWDSYKYDAAWNMRWRARLRRYRDPPPEVAALIPENASNIIKPFIDRVVH